MAMPTCNERAVDQPTGKRESQIRREMNRLQMGVKHLQESVAELRERLCSVCSEDAPAPEVAKTKATEIPVPLADEIETAANGVNQAHADLRCLVARLEL